jgi:transcriptional regulator with PAS, ATPase and Fis domain
MKGHGLVTFPGSQGLVTHPAPPRRRRAKRRHSRHGGVGDAQGSLRDIERAYVQQVLAKSATLGEAAKRLGINLATLWRKRKRWGLAYTAVQKPADLVSWHLVGGRSLRPK